IIRAEGGGTLEVATLQGNLTAGIQFGSSSAIVLGGTYTVDQAITVPAGNALYLGGSATLASPGIISAAGATVYITGTLTSTGGTLLLNATTGNWQLLGGALASGTTVLATGGAKLIATSSGGTLTSATLDD